MLQSASFKPVSENYQPQQVCTLYVARPGPTSDNADRRWSSSDETPLSEDGIAKARKVANAFKDVRFDKVYCSKAKRTSETAEIILDGQAVQIQPENIFYEMDIGPTEGKTPKEIKAFFYQETGYPDLSTRPKFPKLWAKRSGNPIEADDLFLDKWREDMDTFDNFSTQFIIKLKELVHKHLGQKLLIVPHGTPMKAIIAEATGTSSDRVTCLKGSYYVVTVDANGKFFLKEDTMHGVSIDQLPIDGKKTHFFTKNYFISRIWNFKYFKAILCVSLLIPAFIWSVKKYLTSRP